LKENEVCLQQMEHILKADIRPSAEVIKELQKQHKNDKQAQKEPKEVIRK
jgi:ABC-type uncharacterized transport system substrate-binding protein